ncbi:MAG: DNA-binding NtrC family response regulator [Paraglaciecola sp.]|jgi:DNA-binding NtrC family response regulator
MQYLEQYNWPRNIRELENIIERQVILAKDHKLSFNFLATQSPSGAPMQVPQSQLLTAQNHKQLEKNNIEAAMKHCNGKIYGQDGAAALLGLKSTTLVSKLKNRELIAYYI